MKQITAILTGFGSTIQLLVRALSYTATLPRQWTRFIEQCYLIGYTTLPIVAILSFFIGSVLALQAGYSMADFGAKEFIGTLVGLSMARELGPVMVAILVAGRVGSAIAAELASMKVYQEIDVLETMNIPPARMLVLPRLAAILVMMPVLAIIADLVGWYGGGDIVTANYVPSTIATANIAALANAVSGAPMALVGASGAGITVLTAAAPARFRSAGSRNQARCAHPNRC
jgi:phospholipid/cholesterol/gamma-HCH transport system permease protein